MNHSREIKYVHKQLFSIKQMRLEIDLCKEIQQRKEQGLPCSDLVRQYDEAENIIHNLLK